MNRLTAILSSGCAAAMIAGNGIAAAPQANQNNRQNTNQQDRAQSQPILRASELLKAEVQTPEGDRLGTVDEVAIHRPSGQCVYAIVKTSSARQFNHEKKAVPFLALRGARPQDGLRIDTSVDRFRDAPPFEDENWNTIGDRPWGRIVYQHYGMEFDASELMPQADEDADDDEKSRPKLVRASKLLERELENRQDQKLGEVADLAIHMRQGRVLYVVVGDAPVADDKLAIIPWQAIQGHSDDALVLNLQRERLREAPAIDEDRWSNLMASDFSRRVHEFYNTNPDWVYGSDEPRRNRDDRQDRPRDRDSQADEGHGWLPQDEYGRRFDREAIETFRGEVTERRFFTPMQGMARGILLRVRRDNGQMADVHVGPAWYVNRQQGNVREGDQIEVTGSRIRGDTAPAYMAVEIRRGDSTMVLRDRSNGLPMWDAWRGTQYVESERND